MRRLEYTRRTRTATTRASSATEAVMALAQFARERQRLQQERAGIEKRIRRIDGRLLEIASTETRLVPLIQHGLQRLPSSHGATSRGADVVPPGAADGAGEVM